MELLFVMLILIAVFVICLKVFASFVKFVFNNAFTIIAIVVLVSIAGGMSV